jgi:hypothetical protein
MVTQISSDGGLDYRAKPRIPSNQGSQSAPRAVENEVEIPRAVRATSGNDLGATSLNEQRGRLLAQNEQSGNPNTSELEKEHLENINRQPHILGEVEKGNTRFKINDVISQKGSGFTFDGKILNENGRLTIDPLITLIKFVYHNYNSVNSDSHYDPWNLKNRFGPVSEAVNQYLNFKHQNNNGLLREEEEQFELARKLISHTESDPINSLTQSELKGLANSGDFGRHGFIRWVLRVTLDAVNGDKSIANSIGLQSYDDLLRLLNNIKSLTEFPQKPELRIETRMQNLL